MIGFVWLNASHENVSRMEKNKNKKVISIGRKTINEMADDVNDTVNMSVRVGNYSVVYVQLKIYIRENGARNRNKQNDIKRLISSIETSIN